MPVKAIVCVDKNWGIGYNGELLFHIPEDMKFFKEKTIGNTVVMGRKTYESIGKPLKNRENLIITRSISEPYKKIADNTLLTSVDFVDGYMVGSIDSNPDKIFYVIGGESIYKRYMDIYDEIYVTIVDEIKKSDKHFINLFSDNSNYKLDHVLKCGETENGVKYMITKWVRK